MFNPQAMAKLKSAIADVDFAERKVHRIMREEFTPGMQIWFLDTRRRTQRGEVLYVSGPADDYRMKIKSHVDWQKKGKPLKQYLITARRIVGIVETAS